MMILFPLLRRFMNTLKIFYTCFIMSFLGYGVLLAESFILKDNVYYLLIPAFLIMSALGMLNVVQTIFLANTVDYGELKNRRRDESVIFSMQTFVVKLSSGVAAFVAGIVLSVCNIKKDTEAVVSGEIAASTRTGLRMSMTIIPIIILAVGITVFAKKYILTDEYLAKITEELKERRNEAGE